MSNWDHVNTTYSFLYTHYKYFIIVLSSFCRLFAYIYCASDILLCAYTTHIG